jgi:adenylate cyclase
VGDAVLVVFGVPEALQGHAEAALRCALAMQARQMELNEEAEARGVPPLGMGIGVNTGTVMAGTMGGGGRLQYTVIGDAVNVAARIQGEAEAGEVLATAATVAAAPRVPVEPAGTRQVKGRKEPVELYRVLGD